MGRLGTCPSRTLTTIASMNTTGYTGRFPVIVANPERKGFAMPRYAPNKMPAAVKRRYFELIRQGCRGRRPRRQVGVSLSCGSLWFIDAGSVRFVETPDQPRYLTQDDRIEIADGLARGEPVKEIAARIGKTYQSVYREIARNRKPDGRYQPWYAHNQAYLRRRRPKPRRFAVDVGLREAVAGKLGQALVTGPDQPLAAAPLPRRRVLARVHRDDLRGGLPRPDRRQSTGRPAHRPDLSASPRPRPNPRRCAQAVHEHEVDPPAAAAVEPRAPGRALGRRPASSAPGNARRSPRWLNARPGSRSWCRLPRWSLRPVGR